MATTGIIQRRGFKSSLIANPPLTGEIVYALDTEEFGTIKNGVLIWRKFESSIISVNGKTGVVNLNKADIGLNNVDNTSDLNKPVSNAVKALIKDKSKQVDWNETNTQNLSYIKNKPKNITTQGNLFNGSNQLVKLDDKGKLPNIDGTKLYLGIINGGTF